MDFDGKLSQLKISIGSCNTRYSQNLEEEQTEASTHASDTEWITSKKLVDSDYDAILDN